MSRAAPRAILLSAGRGSRLGALTRDKPKCLLELAGRPILDWQIDALHEAGIHDIVVIIGFGAARVEKHLARRPAVRTFYNPFYHVADNLASLWLAREFMDRDFLVLNGDTLVAPDVIQQLATRATAPINVTVSRKDDYDDDDMKVRLSGNRVEAVGKRLPVDRMTAESIGLLLFQDAGVGLFRSAVEAALRSEAGTTSWYLAVVDALARQNHVFAVEVADGLAAEVDYPADVPVADALVAGWSAPLASSA